jgi:hypothetical protein
LQIGKYLTKPRTPCSKKNYYVWVARKEYMVKKLEKFSNSQKEKKIIVLTILSHKYYLVDKFKNPPGIELKNLKGL